MYLPNPVLNRNKNKIPLSSKYPWLAGRWRRTTYTLAILLIFVPIFVLIAYLASSDGTGSPPGSAIIYLFSVMGPILLAIGSLIPISIVQFFGTAGRLRDINANPNLAYLYFVPVIGFFQTVYLCLVPGTEGSNKYGKDPRGAVPVSKVPSFAVTDDDLVKILRKRELSKNIGGSEGNALIIIRVGFEQSVSKYYLSVAKVSAPINEIEKQYFLTYPLMSDALYKQTGLHIFEFVDANT